MQCPKCLRYSRPGETCCICGRMLQGITDEAKKQAEQRISSRYIMYVLGFCDLALKIPNGPDAMVNLKIGKTTQKITWIPRRSILAKRSWSVASMKSKTKSACMNKDTRRPMWKKLTKYCGKGRVVQLLLKNGVTEITARSCNPIKEEAATPRKPKNTLQHVLWKRENLTSHSQNPHAERRSSWSSWTWLFPARSSWWDYPTLSHSWRQSP